MEPEIGQIPKVWCMPAVEKVQMYICRCVYLVVESSNRDKVERDRNLRRLYTLLLTISLLGLILTLTGLSSTPSSSPSASWGSFYVRLCLEPCKGEVTKRYCCFSLPLAA